MKLESPSTSKTKPARGEILSKQSPIDDVAAPVFLVGRVIVEAGDVFLLQAHAEVQGEPVGDGPAVLQVEGQAVGADVAELAVLAGVGEKLVDAGMGAAADFDADAEGQRWPSTWRQPE